MKTVGQIELRMSLRLLVPAKEALVGMSPADNNTVEIDQSRAVSWENRGVPWVRKFFGAECFCVIWSTAVVMMGMGLVFGPGIMYIGKDWPTQWCGTTKAGSSRSSKYNKAASCMLDIVSTGHARCLLATLRGVLPSGVFHCFWAGLGVMFR